MNYKRLSYELSRKYAMDMAMVMHKLSYENAKREAIWDELMLAYWKRLCKSGHKMVGDGYGNAESGGDGAHCTRCGYSWFVRFY